MLRSCDVNFRNIGTEIHRHMEKYQDNDIYELGLSEEQQKGLAATYAQCSLFLQWVDSGRTKFDRNGDETQGQLERSEIIELLNGKTDDIDLYVKVEEETPDNGEGGEEEEISYESEGE